MSYSALGIGFEAGASFSTGGGGNASASTSGGSGSGSGTGLCAYVSPRNCLTLMTIVATLIKEAQGGKVHSDSELVGRLCTYPFPGAIPGTTVMSGDIVCLSSLSKLLPMVKGYLDAARPASRPTFRPELLSQVKSLLSTPTTSTPTVLSTLRSPALPLLRPSADQPATSVVRPGAMLPPTTGTTYQEGEQAPPAEQPPPAEEPAASGIPTWVYVAGGAAVLGAVFLATRPGA